MTMRRHHDQVDILVCRRRGDLSGRKSAARKSLAPGCTGDSVARYVIEFKLCFPLPERHANEAEAGNSADSGGESAGTGLGGEANRIRTAGTGL
jgi:hypothetical protein